VIGTTFFTGLVRIQRSYFTVFHHFINNMTACQLSWLLWSLLLFGGVYGGVGSVADEAYVTADGEMGAAAYLE
jgi:hypothetical protein